MENAVRFISLHKGFDKKDSFLKMCIMKEGDSFTLEFFDGDVKQIKTPTPISMELVEVEWDKLFHEITVLENYSVFNVIDKTGPQFWEKLIKKNGLCISNHSHEPPSEDLEYAAIMQNWQSIKYIKNLSEKNCIAAYDQDVRALVFLWGRYNKKDFNLYNKDLFTDFEAEHRILLALDQSRKLSFEIFKQLQEPSPNSCNKEVQAGYATRKPRIL